MEYLKHCHILFHFINKILKNSNIMRVLKQSNQLSIWYIRWPVKLLPSARQSCSSVPELKRLHSVCKYQLSYIITITCSVLYQVQISEISIFLEIIQNNRLFKIIIKSDCFHKAFTLRHYLSVNQNCSSTVVQRNSSIAGCVLVK